MLTRNGNFNGRSCGNTKIHNIASAQQQGVADQIAYGFACWPGIASDDNFWPLHPLDSLTPLSLANYQGGKSHCKCSEILRCQAFADNSPYP